MRSPGAYPGWSFWKKWDYEVGFVRNGELQYYTQARPKNCRIENGMLILEGHKERMRNPGYNPKGTGCDKWKMEREFAEYTAASIHTHGKASWTYGRIDVRAKLPTGRGTWPAIWMLGTNIFKVGWPRCGEIDILENLGFDPDTAHTTVHTAKYYWGNGGARGHAAKVERPYDCFHVHSPATPVSPDSSSILARAPAHQVGIRRATRIRHGLLARTRMTMCSFSGYAVSI